MAVRHLEAVQQLSGSAARTESRPSRIGPINLDAKQTGERSAGNPHAAFDVAGTGNVAWSRCCDTRRRKGEATGNTNFDLHRRASPRPYPASCGLDPEAAALLAQRTHFAFSDNSRSKYPIVCLSPSRSGTVGCHARRSFAS